MLVPCDLIAESRRVDFSEVGSRMLVTRVWGAGGKMLVKGFNSVSM